MMIPTLVLSAVSVYHKHTHWVIASVLGHEWQQVQQYGVMLCLALQQLMNAIFIYLYSSLQKHVGTKKYK